MNIIKRLSFYIKKNIKWILYNSILLIIVYFCIFQIYGRINYEFNDDTVVISKKLGVSIPYILGDQEKKIEEIKKIDNYKSMKILLNISNYLYDDKFYNANFKFFIFFDEENYVKFGRKISNEFEGKVVVPLEYYNKNELNIGDEIKINGKRFVIEGVGNYISDESFIISYLDYKNMNIDINSINVKASDEINKENIENFKSDLERISGSKIKIYNPKDNPEEKMENYKIFLIIFLLSLLTMRSFYKFSLERKFIFTKIMRISGMNKNQMIYSEIVLLFIIFIFSFFISVILINLFNKALDVFINLNHYYMEIKHYAIIFSILLCFYLSIMSLEINKNLKRFF